ncbi:MAG: hypothetical protein E6H07_15580 [Bacteroidetes bacterium]|nr:MAG: hypothetical protein E6H07_15580 [Bacteroidota bacterium]
MKKNTIKTPIGIQKQHETEITLRGTVLTVSVNIEVVLMRIIYFSNGEHYENPKSPSLKIKNLTFSSKINRVKEVLKLHHSDLLAEYQNLFTTLEGFLVIRNQIAHCAIYWIDEKLNDFEIWDVVEGDIVQYYSPIKYTRVEIATAIIEYFNKITPPLLSLENEVSLRLKLSHPQIYSQLSSATQHGG